MARQALYLFLGNTFVVQVRNDVESDPVGTIILYQEIHLEKTLLLRRKRYFSIALKAVEYDCDYYTIKKWA